MYYFKYNVNPSKILRMDKVFLGLAGLLLKISLGLCPREIPRSSSASPWETPSIPSLFLGLTQYSQSIMKTPGNDFDALIQEKS